MKYNKPKPISTNILCEFNCGVSATHITSSGKFICKESPNSCPINIAKNSFGLKESYRKGVKKAIYQELSQDAKDRMSWSRGKILTPNEDIFIENSSHSTGIVKERILKLKLLEYICDVCSLTEWNGKSIVLDLDHIDGNNRNNQLKNLRFLCPNCHSQTDTYKGRNINNGLKKVSDSILIESLKTTNNIRQALINVGLAPKGANYTRAKKLLEIIEAT